jgi:hypothetical protein
LSALRATLDAARFRGAIAGLHCCAAGPLSRMYRAKPDILSFDAHEGLESFFSNPASAAFVRDGGTVAYGLIPTLRDLKGVSAERIFTRWLTLASLAGDPQRFARQALVTATCGLGLLPEESVPESFRLAKAVGQLMRDLAEAPADAFQPIATSESTGS